MHFLFLKITLDIPTSETTRINKKTTLLVYNFLSYIIIAECVKTLSLVNGTNFMPAVTVNLIPVGNPVYYDKKETNSCDKYEIKTYSQHVPCLTWLAW